jgi:hypothetical protein
VDLPPLWVLLHCTTVLGARPTEAGVSVQALLGEDDGGSATDDAGVSVTEDAGRNPADAAVVIDGVAGAGPPDAGSVPSYSACEATGEYVYEPLAPLCAGKGTCTLVFELELVPTPGRSQEAGLAYDARVTRSDGGFGYCDETIPDYPRGAFVRVELDA